MTNIQYLSYFFSRKLAYIKYMSYICHVIKINKDMATKYDTNWIMSTAQRMYEATLRYNSRFTMEKAIDRATERAKELNEALNNSACTIDEHDNIIELYDFSNIQSLSVYGSGMYCGD
mgnify:FL=1